jgi:nucleotide sugar dehydrogenase
MTTIIIQGQGVVGQATELFLKTYNEDLNIVFNDPYKDVFVPAEDWAKASYVIVCVNTNLNQELAIPENSTTNVDAAINQALQNGFKGKIVLRSTSGIESVKLLEDQLAQNLIVWPEYIRESSWKEDAVNPTMIVLGGAYAEQFSELFGSYQGSMIITEPIEAMVAKLSTNTFLAMKVVFANQVKQICDVNGLDYNVVQQLLENEGRLGSSHWSVPGPDGSNGFGGKCFPKDVKTFEAALIKGGMHIDLIRAISDLNADMRSNEKR